MKKVIFNKRNSVLIMTGIATLSVPVILSSCSPSVSQKYIDILSINDFHGQIEEVYSKSSQYYSSPGIMRLADQVNELKKQSIKDNGVDTTYLVGSGDLYQGSIDSNLSFGASTGEMLGAMGMEWSVIGNHEFDWTQSMFVGGGSNDSKGTFTEFNNANEKANFKGWLGANIFADNNDNGIIDENEKPVDWAKPYAIEDIQGVKVAFVGYTTAETATLTVKSNVTHLLFADASKPEGAKILQDHIDNIKNNNLADVVVLLTHEGGSFNNQTQQLNGNIIPIMKNLSGVDAILSGHSHQKYNTKIKDKDNKDIQVVQGGKYGTGIQSLRIDYTSSNGNITIDKLTTSVVDVNTDIDEQGIVNKNNDYTNTIYTILEKWRKEVEVAKKEHIFENKYAFNKTGNYLNGAGVGFSKMLFDLATENNTTYDESKISFKLKTEDNSTDPKMTLWNNGGIRDSLGAGDITYGDLYRVLPFDNTTYVFKNTVEDILKSFNLTLNGTGQEGSSGRGMPQFYSDELQFKFDTKENKFTEILKKDTSSTNPSTKEDTYTKLNPTDKITVITNDFYYMDGDNALFQTNTKNNEFRAIQNPLREDLKKWLQTKKTFDYNFTDVEQSRLLQTFDSSTTE